MSRRPVARKKLVWRTYWDTPAALMPQVSSDAVGGNIGFTSQYLVDSGELSELDDECVVKRVVGDVHFLVQGYEPPTAIGEWSLVWALMAEKVDATANVFPG